MLKKLKSVLGSHRVLLLVLFGKAAAFSTLLYLARDSGWFLFIFFLAAFYFYFRKTFNAGKFLASFVILLGASIFALKALPIQNNPIFAGVIPLSGALFFLILGIKNLAFLQRRIWYYFLSSFLFLAVLVIFFWMDKSQLFFGKYLTIGLTLFFLFREFLEFNLESGGELRQLIFGGKKNVVSLVFAYLTLQFLWAMAFLPIGFLNSASLGLLTVLVLTDLAVHNWEGTLDRRIILRNITIFLLTSLIIFAFSRWAL